MEASGKVRKPRTKSGKESTAKNAQESPKIESKSADHKPANHKSADYKPVNHKSTDHKSTNHKSTDHKFADLGPPAEVDEAVEEFFGVMDNVLSVEYVLKHFWDHEVILVQTQMYV